MNEKVSFADFAAANIVEMLLKDSLDPIIDLGECELLCQLAEEASELVQAALKDEYRTEVHIR